MKFGKNQGCKFLNKDCLGEDLETDFKNDFFDPSLNWYQSCTSGRQSRAYFFYLV